MFNFVKQDFDDNYPRFLAELLSERYLSLASEEKITTDISLGGDGDIEGTLVVGALRRPEGPRYFHMIHGHVRYMETRQKISKEKVHAIQWIFQ